MARSSAYPRAQRGARRMRRGPTPGARLCWGYDSRLRFARTQRRRVDMSVDRASLEERSILTPDQRLRVFISSTLNELADCLYGFAALALHAGDAEEAAVLVGAADATRERTG